MKGYYLFAPVEPGNAGPESGVERKVRAQHKALSQYLDCELVILPPVQYTGSIAEKIIRRLPYTAAWRRWKYNGEFDDADFLYIRQVYHDASFVRYLRAIRRKNPKVKIVYEVPTYPYLTEQRTSAANRAFRKKEIRWGPKCAEYLDRIVTFYGQNEIWGVPCIQLQNGFDFSSVTLPKRRLTPDIHMLSVAATAFWHGYDRLLEGLGRYYADGGRENIVYHMIGDILPEHQRLVEQYGIESHVLFHGRLSAQQMKPIYGQCVLGVDVLGGHRKDYPVSSSLKSREYAAYGLPILTSSPVDYLPENYPYQLIVPYDDSAIAVSDLLSFIKRIYKSESMDDIAKKIRDYAFKRTNMLTTIEPVTEWLIKESSK